MTLATELTRAVCTAGDIHLVCTYPDCTCKITPQQATAALTFLRAYMQRPEVVERVAAALWDSENPNGAGNWPLILAALFECPGIEVTVYRYRNRARAALSAALEEQA